jgi:ABC-2 type transport system permease protein
MTGTLLLAALRQDRRRVQIWVSSLTAVTVYAVVALHLVYPTAADREGRATAVRTPAGVLLSGPGYGVGGDYTLGAMLANELLLSVMVATALMAVLLVVRHTRGAEDGGTADLVRAGAVGRPAPLLAGLLVGVVASTGVGVGVAVGLLACGLVVGGLGVADCLAVAVGVALVGTAFAGLAGIAAQLLRSTRAASGAAGAVLVAAVLLRGVGDRVQGGSAPSWASPLGWVQQTRAFVDLRVWPLLLVLALAAALLAVALRLAAHREVGAALVGTRHGPASGRLAGPVGLVVRLLRGTVTGWAVGLVLLGAVFGSFADAVGDLVAGNDRLAPVFGGGGSLVDGFTAATGRYLGLAVAGFAIGALLRARAEETAGRTAVLLALPVGRTRLLVSWLGVVAAAASGLVLLGGLAAGLSAHTSGAGSVGGFVGAAAVQLPAVLATCAVTTLLVGAAPRWAALAWALLVWQVIAGLFGPLLSLPGWALRLSPAGWLPQVPAERLAVAPLAGLLAVGAVLVAVALAGHRRRDLLTG